MNQWKLLHLVILKSKITVLDSNWLFNPSQWKWRTIRKSNTTPGCISTDNMGKQCNDQALTVTLLPPCDISHVMLILANLVFTVMSPHTMLLIHSFIVGHFTSSVRAAVCSSAWLFFSAAWKAESLHLYRLKTYLQKHLVKCGLTHIFSYLLTQRQCLSLSLLRVYLFIFQLLSISTPSLWLWPCIHYCWMSCLFCSPVCVCGKYSVKTKT